MAEEVFKSHAAKHFEIRLNYETDGVALQPSMLQDALKQATAEYVFQLEQSEGGYPHYQGHIKLLKKTRALSFVNAFLNLHGIRINYCRPTVAALVSGHPSKLPRYATKFDTRVQGPWSNDTEEVYLPVQYRHDTLLPFQQRIWDSYDAHWDRTVNVIIDQTGSCGKSTIGAILELKKRGYVLPPCHNSDELLQSAHGMLHHTTHPGVVLMDMPRSFDQERTSGIYVAIEEIKNGRVYDKRYAFKKHYFDSPQVWVFTNTIPSVRAMSQLSTDRWKFWRITETKDLQHVRIDVLGATPSLVDV